MIEDPLGEQLHTAVPDLDFDQRETMARAVGEALAGIYRFTVPTGRIGSISGTDSRGLPVVGPFSRSWAHSSSASRAEGPFSTIQQYVTLGFLSGFHPPYPHHSKILT